ncbi:MAG: hypothetical protein H6581_03915 [Bacteroidia bacterium]|nr:hypothetical protein [Bacteroidia bacterium]
MKKTITFVFFCAILFCSVSGQSLAFNQVRFIEYEFTVPPNPPVNSMFFDTTLVVPIGKVLKINSIGGSKENPGSTTPGPAPSSNLDFYLNNACLRRVQASTGKNGAEPDFPVWLPAGTYDIRIYSNYSSLSLPTIHRGFISAIEFNVVP